MSSAKILAIAYAQHWHINRSDAFNDLLVAPMFPYTKIEMRGWDGISPLGETEADHCYIFCQQHPPDDWLRKIPNQLVWLPMWDDIRYASQDWWNQLPKSLRIVAFSQAVARHAQAAGLPHIRLQYFKNPDEFTPASWDDERVLLYWNRRGIVSPLFLEKFCKALSIDRLLFRGDTDPGLDVRTYFDLPDQLGKTVVEKFHTTATREDYWRLTERANVMIAPRLHEGAGMVFLEAMARGCAVFANNAPTMNEYIVDQQNGYLLRRPWTYQRLRSVIYGRLSYEGILRTTPFTYAIPENQNWDQIAALDLQEIGKKARENHVEGYRKWSAHIPDYARFLLDKFPHTS